MKNIIRDKKGQFTESFSTFNIFTFMIIAFLAVVFFGGLIYVQGIITNTLIQAGASNEMNAGQPGYTNMTQAAIVTFGQVNDSIQALRMVAVVLIFSVGIGIIITNSLVKIHPLFFFPYMLICGLAVWFAAPISNSYQALYGSDIYGGNLHSFTGANYVLFNLPTFVLIISVLGGIFLFINIVRQGNQGTIT